jgi:hypothetical protein
VGDYRATPEQWAQCEVWGAYDEHPMGCILELRARVEALEAAQATPTPAPVLSLVDQVACAIGLDTDPINWVPEARAAIREVTTWLQSAGHWEAADALEQEVQR